MILKCFGEGEANKRQVLTADSVSQDEKGLKQLLVSNIQRYKFSYLRSTVHNGMDEMVYVCNKFLSL